MRIMPLLFILLTGCATDPSGPPLGEFKFPAPVSCVKTVPIRPAFTPEPKLKAMDDGRLANTLLHEHYTGQIYMGELEAVVAGCI